MCAGAMVNARVGRLVYGCVDPKAGACTTLFTIGTDVRLNHRFPMVGGVLADECADRLRRFFARCARRGRSSPRYFLQIARIRGAGTPWKGMADFM